MSSSLYVRPSKGLSSALTGNTLSSGKSLHTIIKDVKKQGAGLSDTKKLMIAKTIRQMNDDPTKIQSRTLAKEAIKLMGEAGHIAEHRANNPLGTLQHIVNEYKKANPSEEKQERLKKVHIQETQRERQEEEARTAKAAAPTATAAGPDDHKDARVGIGQVLEEKNRHQTSIRKPGEDHATGTVVDMMID